MGWGRQTPSTHTRRIYGLGQANSFNTHEANFRLGLANSLTHTRRILGWGRAIFRWGRRIFYHEASWFFFGTWGFVLGVGQANFLLMVRWGFFANG